MSKKNKINRSAQPYSGIDVDIIQYHSDGSFAKRTLRSIFGMTPVQYRETLPDKSAEPCTEPIV